jgi:hypothetical protein
MVEQIRILESGIGDMTVAALLSVTESSFMQTFRLSLASQPSFSLQ